MTTITKSKKEVEEATDSNLRGALDKLTNPN